MTRLIYGSRTVLIVGFITVGVAATLGIFLGIAAGYYGRIINLLIMRIMDALMGFPMMLLALILAAVLGLFNAVDIPTRQAFIVDLAGKEDLGNAIALNSFLVNASRILGPVLAGFMVVHWGEGICFLINALSYLGVIYVLLRLPSSEPLGANGLSFWDSFEEGIRYVAGTPSIRDVLILMGLISFAGLPYLVLLPIFADQVFGYGPAALGGLTGATGLGAVLGALYLARRSSLEGLGRIIAVSGACFGGSLLLFGFSRWYGLSLGLMVLAGLGLIAQMAGSNILLQHLSQENFRGRVMSFYSMMFIGMAPFGSLWLGVLAHAVGAPRAVIWNGLACILAAVWFYPKLRSVI